MTLQPKGMFSRTLKFEIALRAFVTIGFWPAIIVRSRTADWIFFVSAVVSPTPMLMTILSSLGTCIGFL